MIPRGHSDSENSPPNRLSCHSALMYMQSTHIVNCALASGVQETNLTGSDLGRSALREQV
jgi:hypothetical protein